MGARFLAKDDRDALGIIARDDGLAAVVDAPSSAPIATQVASTIGEAGGPKASASVAEPPPAAEVNGTDLPVLSNGHAKLPAKPLDLGGAVKVSFSVSADSPSCADCGSIMVRNGSCYKCLNCGSTSGCS